MDRKSQASLWFTAVLDRARANSSAGFLLRRSRTRGTLYQLAARRSIPKPSHSKNKWLFSNSCVAGRAVARPCHVGAATPRRIFQGGEWPVGRGLRVTVTSKGCAGFRV